MTPHTPTSPILLAHCSAPCQASHHKAVVLPPLLPPQVAIPDADIPTVAVSLVAGLDPALHIRIGEALAPLRDEGVFIIGSGMSFHNLRTFGSTSALPASKAFDKWIHDTVGQSKDARNKGLEAWHEAPYARDCHPQEEHLLPLMGEGRGG